MTKKTLRNKAGIKILKPSSIKKALAVTHAMTQKAAGVMDKTLASRRGRTTNGC